MKKLLRYAAAGAMLMSMATVNAQQVIPGDGVTIHPLGGFKTWTKTVDNQDQTFTQTQAELDKIIATPTNTANIYLFPEAGGGWVTDANKAIGIQGVYIDMGAQKEVGTVSTTWEGACAGYSLWLSDVEPTGVPTGDALATQARGTNLTTKLPAGSKGRYLILQPNINDVANLGWGVKIRSISAAEPVETVLTSFKASPSFVPLNTPTKMTYTFKDQLGVEIERSEITSITVEGGNATLSQDDMLTITSGNSTTLKATMGDKSITFVVFAPTAPVSPNAAEVQTSVYTNGIQNGLAGVQWGVGWNGGATNMGQVGFPDGIVAMAFGPQADQNQETVFFSNTAIKDKESGSDAIDCTFDPSQYGAYLRLSIYGSKDCEGKILFERTTTIGNEHPFTVKAGEWNDIEINLQGENTIHSTSIRFQDENMCDFLVSNIYFAPAFIEGDEQAPVIDEFTAEATGVNTIKLTIKATDDKNSKVSYELKYDDQTVVLSGKSGEAIDYTVENLLPMTQYTFTLTATDGKNQSEAKEIKEITWAPEYTVEASNATATGATTATVDYTITCDVENITFKVWAVNGANQPISEVVTGTAKTGKLELKDLNSYAENAFIIYAQAVNGEFEADAVSSQMIELNTMDAFPKPVLTISNAKATSGTTGTLDYAIECNDAEGLTFNISAEDADGKALCTPIEGSTAKSGTLTLEGLAEYAVTAVVVKVQAIVGELEGEVVAAPAVDIDTTPFDPAGIEGVAVDTDKAAYYTVDGVRVENPAKGLYIRIENGKAVKVVK